MFTNIKNIFLGVNENDLEDEDTRTMLSDDSGMELTKETIEDLLGLSPTTHQTPNISPLFLSTPKSKNKISNYDNPMIHPELTAGSIIFNQNEFSESIYRNSYDKNLLSEMKKQILHPETRNKDLPLNFQFNKNMEISTVRNEIPQLGTDNNSPNNFNSRKHNLNNIEDDLEDVEMVDVQNECEFEINTENHKNKKPKLQHEDIETNDKSTTEENNSNLFSLSKNLNLKRIETDPFIFNSILNPNENLGEKILNNNSQLSFFNKAYSFMSNNNGFDSNQDRYRIKLESSQDLSLLLQSKLWKRIQCYAKYGPSEIDIKNMLRLNNK